MTFERVYPAKSWCYKRRSFLKYAFLCQTQGSQGRGIERPPPPPFYVGKVGFRCEKSHVGRPPPPITPSHPTPHIPTPETQLHRLVRGWVSE